jgi:hypothetical protein
VLELVDSLNLKLSDASRERSTRSSGKNIYIYFYLFVRGYSLIGKTAILHIVISGSSPDNSISIKIYMILISVREAQPGRAEH